MVRVVGLEPTCQKAMRFKHIVYTIPPHSHKKWSDMQDSNLRPSAPKADALPNCANIRCNHSTISSLKSQLQIIVIVVFVKYNFNCSCCSPRRIKYPVAAAKYKTIEATIANQIHAAVFLFILFSVMVPPTGFEPVLRSNLEPMPCIRRMFYR